MSHLQFIKIFYKIPIIQESYFNNNQLLNKKDLKQISNYLAAHEYCH